MATYPLVGTGQITLNKVAVSERAPSFEIRGNINCNQSKDNTVYMPDYSDGSPLVVSPWLYFGNDNYTTKLSAVNIIQQQETIAPNLFYYFDDVLISSESSDTSPYLSGNTIIFNQNLIQGSHLLKAVISAGALTDEKTQQVWTEQITDMLSLSCIASGTSVTEIEQQYIQDSYTSRPSSDDSNWASFKTVKPTENGLYTWERVKTVYSNGTVTYSKPVMISDIQRRSCRIKIFSDSGYSTQTYPLIKELTTPFYLQVVDGYGNAIQDAVTWSYFTSSNTSERILTSTGSAKYVFTPSSIGGIKATDSYITIHAYINGNTVDNGDLAIFTNINNKNKGLRIASSNPYDYFDTVSGYARVGSTISTVVRPYYAQTLLKYKAQNKLVNDTAASTPACTVSLSKVGIYTVAGTGATQEIYGLIPNAVITITYPTSSAVQYKFEIKTLQGFTVDDTSKMINLPITFKYLAKTSDGNETDQPVVPFYYGLATSTANYAVLEDNTTYYYLSSSDNLTLDTLVSITEDEQTIEKNLRFCTNKQLRSCGWQTQITYPDFNNRKVYKLSHGQYNDNSEANYDLQIIATYVEPAPKVDITANKLHFTNDDDNDIVLSGVMYVGDQQIGESAITYAWSSVPSIIFASGNSGKTLTVTRDEIPNAATITCSMTYKNKTYSSSVIVQDEVDSTTANITSSNGDKFTTTTESTTLTCHIYNSGEEITTNSHYSYVWYKNNAIIDGSTEPTLLVGKDDVIIKSIYTCLVKYDSSSVASAQITLLDETDLNLIINSNTLNIRVPENNARVSSNLVLPANDQKINFRLVNNGSTGSSISLQNNQIKLASTAVDAEATIALSYSSLMLIDLFSSLYTKTQTVEVDDGTTIQTQVYDDTLLDNINNDTIICTYVYNGCNYYGVISWVKTIENGWYDSFKIISYTAGITAVSSITNKRYTYTYSPSAIQIYSSTVSNAANNNFVIAVNFVVNEINKTSGQVNNYYFLSNQNDSNINLDFSTIKINGSSSRFRTTASQVEISQIIIYLFQYAKDDDDAFDLFNGYTRNVIYTDADNSEAIAEIITENSDSLISANNITINIIPEFQSNFAALIGQVDNLQSLNQQIKQDNGGITISAVDEDGIAVSFMRLTGAGVTIGESKDKDETNYSQFTQTYARFGDFGIYRNEKSSDKGLYFSRIDS